MTHIIIENEGDLERGLNTATELARADGSEKFLEITFPSKFLSKVFVNNLMLHWYNEKVSPNNGLSISMWVPGEERGLDEIDY